MLLIIYPDVSEATIPGQRGGDDTSLIYQGVSQHGLAMIHVGDDRHVPDVGLLVLDGLDLVYCEVHHDGRWWWSRSEVSHAEDCSNEGRKEIHDILRQALYTYEK